jgi:hypothetical protein
MVPTLTPAAPASCSWFQPSSTRAARTSLPCMTWLSGSMLPSSRMEPPRMAEIAWMEDEKPQLLPIGVPDGCGSHPTCPSAI